MENKIQLKKVKVLAIMAGQDLDYELIEQQKTSSNKQFFVEKITIKDLETNRKYFTIASKLSHTERFNGLSTVVFETLPSPAARKTHRKPTKRKVKNGK